jgi:hypothetical protein
MGGFASEPDRSSLCHAALSDWMLLVQGITAARTFAAHIESTRHAHDDRAVRASPSAEEQYTASSEVSYRGAHST